MEKLNFPIFKEDLMPHRSLSMDEFVKFLRACRKFYFNRKAYDDQKKRSSVNVAFRLK